MKLKAKLGNTLGVITLLFIGTVRTNADAVVDWNAIAVQAIGTAVPPRPGPPIAFLDLAMVQTAVHDAVQAIDRRFEPYHVEIPDASGSPAAAAAKAAHDVLASILPAQSGSLGTNYTNYLASHGLPENDPGVAVGAAAAAAIIALRVNDGRVPNPLPAPFTGGTDPGGPVVWSGFDRQPRSSTSARSSARSTPETRSRRCACPAAARSSRRSAVRPGPQSPRATRRKTSRRTAGDGFFQCIVDQRQGFAFTNRAPLRRARARSPG